MCWCYWCNELLDRISGVVVVADGVDLADEGVRGCAGALLWRQRLIVVKGGSAADLRCAAIVEVFEAAGGGEGLIGAPV